MAYEKDYQNWHELKKAIDQVDFPLPFKEREIWWMSLGVNIGVEIDGKGELLEQPALIIKKYNRDHAWIVPLTSSEIKPIEGVHIPIYHSAMGDKSVAVISQSQSISSKRLTYSICLLPPDQFIKILEAIKEALPKYTRDLV